MLWDTSPLLKFGWIILEYGRQSQGGCDGCRVRSQRCIARLFLLCWIMTCAPSSLKLRRHPITAPERTVSFLDDRKPVSPRLRLRRNDQKPPRGSGSIAPVKNGVTLGPSDPCHSHGWTTAGDDIAPWVGGTQRGARTVVSFKATTVSPRLSEMVVINVPNCRRSGEKMIIIITTTAYPLHSARIKSRMASPHVHCL